MGTQQPGPGMVRNGEPGPPPPGPAPEQAAARRAAPARRALARLQRVHPRRWAWRSGADGADEVGAVLAGLVRKDSRWRVLHDIPLGKDGADVDHLVIGPGGVYAVDAKHHPGACLWVGGDMFLVDGVRHPYVRYSRHEAVRASRTLTAACGFPVEVTGVVVPVDAGELTLAPKPRDVHVVAGRRLRRWLRRRDEVLDEGTVAAIHDRARQPSTWRG
jgi:nuclease-like protein